MSKFREAVDNLVGAFSHVISIINTQKVWRRKEGADTTRAAAEERLKKSLKSHKSDVKKAFRRDVKQFGPGFAAGDEEAHSCLSAILCRLNAGFISVAERFTRGRSTSKDYQILLSLSNASRIEAIRTFEQLSIRLSQSSLDSLPRNPKLPRKNRSSSRSPTSSALVNTKTKKRRSKSAPKLFITPEGWVRSKGRRIPSGSISGGSTKLSAPVARRSCSPKSNPPSASTTQEVSPPAQRYISNEHVIRPVKAENRKSIMSFASDSTKLGEIPERKWPLKVTLSPTEFYPLEPYSEPQKQKSRFMRLFRR